MIRVTFEIVPGGNEAAKRKINQLEITNVNTDGITASYWYELQTYRHDMNTIRDGEIVGFDRNSGALELVRLALAQLEATK